MLLYLHWLHMSSLPVARIPCSPLVFPARAQLEQERFVVKPFSLRGNNDIASELPDEEVAKASAAQQASLARRSTWHGLTRSSIVQGTPISPIPERAAASTPG